LNLSSFAAAIYLIIGIGLFFLALIIIRENPKARINKVTSLMLFFAGLGPVMGVCGTILSAVYPEFSESVFYQNMFHLWQFFFPQLLLFSLIFPEEKDAVKRHPRLKYIIFLPYLFHMLLVLVFYDPHKITSLLTVKDTNTVFAILLQPLSLSGRVISVLLGNFYNIHLQLFSLVDLVYLIIAVFVLYQGYRTIKVPRLRMSSKYVLLGINFSMAFYAVAFILPALFPINFSPGLKYFLTIAALLSGAGLIAWAIVRHRFLDVRIVVRQSLVYSLTSAILVGLYFLVVVQFSNFVQSIIGKPVPILDISYVILALILFQPLMGQLDNLIKKTFMKDVADYRNLMEVFSREIVTILDFEKLKQMVFDTLKNNMQVERMCLCVFDNKEKKFMLHSEDKIIPFDEDNEFIGALREEKKPIFFSALKIKKEETPFYKCLSEFKIQLMIPLQSQEGFIGFLGLSEKATGFRYSYEDLTLLNVLGNQLVIAMSNIRLYQDSLEKQRLEEELLRARQIQLSLLPRSLPRGKGFEVSAFIQPARQVGGDYYDFIRLNGEKFGIAIADAAGKGMPAALLVSLMHAFLRAETKNRLPPDEVICNINKLICTSTSSEKFATMFYGEFNPTERRISYCNAGHNYPVVVRKEGEVEYLQEGGLIIGAFPKATYEKAEQFFNADDTVVMYSDGLTEAFNRAEEQFGEERLLDLLEGAHRHPAEKIKDMIVQEVNNFSRGSIFWDDFTLVVLKVC
jgi:serine phosphatase RsbU (regulator of sigma subunit)